MTDFDSILDECLRRIERGEASLEECLAQHPDHAEALRPLISQALELRDEPSLGPDLRARSRMRARLGQHMRRHPRHRRSWLDGLPAAPALRPAALVLLVVILAFGSATWVAQAAAPGAPLYPLKRASEAVWGRIVGQSREHRLWLAERRLEDWIAVQSADDRAEAAQEAYRQALAALETEGDQELTAPITEELHEQRRKLDAAGLREPKLEELLSESTGATPVPTFEPAAPTPVQPDIEATPTEDSILDELLPTPEDTDILP